MLAELLGAYPPSVLIGLSGLLGLLVGSFLNVVALRLPRRMEYEWRCQCQELLDQGELTLEPPPDLAMVPSHCPNCGHGIRWYENIPVLSWLWLRGRCSACQAAISPLYPVVELTTAVLSAVTIAVIGANAVGLGVLLLTWTLIALTVIDIREQLLPDQLTLPLLWAGLMLNALGLGLSDLESAVWGAIGGYLILWVVFQAFRLLTGKEGMGYGDFKLLAALGAWVGWQLLPVIVILSSFVGAVVGVAFVVIKGRDRNIPIAFGPYLAAAGWLAALWGESLLSSYLRASGLE